MNYHFNLYERAQIKMIIDFQIRLQIGFDEPKIIDMGSLKYVTEKFNQLLEEMPVNDKNLKIWITSTTTQMKGEK